jgi:hypothetical protein
MEDDIADINFRFACRVYNYAWMIVPSPIYFWIETTAWGMSLVEQAENPASAFPILFEETLFTNCPDYYDMIVERLL